MYLYSPHSRSESVILVSPGSAGIYGLSIDFKPGTHTSEAFFINWGNDPILGRSNIHQEITLYIRIECGCLIYHFIYKLSVFALNKLRYASISVLSPYMFVGEIALIKLTLLKLSSINYNISYMFLQKEVKNNSIGLVIFFLSCCPDRK